MGQFEQLKAQILGPSAGASSFAVLLSVAFS